MVFYISGELNAIKASYITRKCPITAIEVVMGEPGNPTVHVKPDTWLSP